MKKRQAKKIEDRKLREAVQALKRGEFVIKWQKDMLVFGRVVTVDVEPIDFPEQVPRVYIRVITDAERIRSLK